MRQHLDDLASFGDRWVSGFDISHSTNSFDVTISTGVAVVDGNRIGDSADSDVTKTLTSNDTFHIYIQSNGNLGVDTNEANLSGAKLYEVTTDGNGVTNVENFRDDTIVFDDPVKGHDFEATSGKKQFTGGEVILDKNEPKISFTDTNDDTETVIKAQNGKLTLEDGSGTTLRDDLRTAGTSNATADTLVKRDGSAEAAFATISLTNLSSGSIPFSAAGSDKLIQDTGLHWDDNNDRLGVKTSNPGSTIDVQGGDLHIQGPEDSSITHTIEQGANTGSTGTPSFQIDLLGSAGASNPVLRINDDGSLEWGPGGSTAVDTKLSRGAADRLDLASGDSLRIVSGSLEWGSSGDVALNRNASDRLDLATGDTFRISSSGALEFGTDVSLSRGTNDRLDLASGDSMSIGGSLRVGGNGTPSDTLDIDGSANISGAATIEDNFTADGTTHTLEGPDDASGTVIVQPGADTGSTGTPDVNLDLRTARGDSNPTVRVDPDNARIEFGPGGGSATDTNLYRSGTGTLKTDDDFAVAGASTLTGDVTLQQASQDYLITGNGSNLDFEASASGNDTLVGLATADSDGTDNLVLSLWGVGDAAATTQERLRLIASTDGTNITEYRIDSDVDGSGNGSHHPIKLESGGNSDQLVARTDGDVSMSGGLLVGGTGSPVHPGTAGIDVSTNGAAGLSLSGDEEAGAGTGTHINVIEGRWANNIIGDIRWIAGDDTTNNDEGDLQFRTASGGTLSEVMRLTQGGRVGIKTSNPNSSLDVVSGSDNAATLTIADHAGASAVDSFIVGRVNTGSNSPSEKHMIIGHRTDTNDAADARHIVHIGGHEQGSWGTINKIALHTGTGDSTGTSQQMTIDASGNVGIGTKNPNVALDVSGTIQQNNNNVLDTSTSAGGDLNGSYPSPGVDDLYSRTSPGTTVSGFVNLVDDNGRYVPGVTWTYSKASPLPIVGYYDQAADTNVTGSIEDFQGTIKVKGHFQANTSTKVNTNLHSWGLSFYGDDDVDNFYEADEAVRDNDGGVAVIVDGSGNVLHGNWDSGGDASLTDSGVNVSLTNGFTWEITITTDSTRNSTNYSVTVKINGNTILSSVSPAFSSCRYLMAASNVDGKAVWSDCVYEVSAF